jgi:type IV pilus assembly protein PilM
MVQLFSKSIVGVDIGTFSIKVVEVSLNKKKYNLDNYGEILAASIGGHSFRAFDKSSLLLSVSQIAQAIRSTLDEAEIKTKKAVFALPDFSTFFTNFSLPPMSNKELTQAVEFEAKRYVPIPLKDLILDWRIVNEGRDKNGEEKVDIVLAAVPKDIVEQYKDIATRAGLDLVALEAEMFGLVKIYGNSEKPVAVLDIGAQSTTVNIIDNDILKFSYSFDVAGNQLTKELSQTLDVDMVKAEESKVKQGISTKEAQKVINGKSTKDVLGHYIDRIINESRTVFNNFERSNEREISKVYLVGGSSLLPGLKEHFSEILGKETEIGNPFNKVSYPPLLKETLEDKGPIFSVVLGTALKGLK